MSKDYGVEDVEALLREVVTLRARVAELQRAAARHEETEGISLAEREEILREAERTAHLGTWTWDIQSGRVTWSDEMYRILALMPEVTPSVETFFAAVHEEDRPRAMATADQAKQDGVLPLMDCRIVRPDGTIRHTFTSGSYLFDQAGNVRRMVGGVLDRTESVQVEAELRRALSLLEEAQSLAHLGSWRYDPQTDELEWSDEFRRIAGLDPHIAPRIENFLEKLVPEERERLRAQYERLAFDPEAGLMDARILHQSGEVRHVRLRAATVLGASGRQELRGTMLDVTDQVRLREELAYSQKMDAVGRLAGGIAHDFNNLLTVITGNVEMFSEELGPTRGLQDCMKALESAAHLTQRLLTFGRRAQLSLSTIAPNELVLSTMGLMQRLIGDQIRLETDLADDVPLFRVDPVEIERALVNLVVNAKNVMLPGGAVTVKTRAGTADGRSTVELSVADEGPGISEADRPHLFDPFYTTRRDAGGTGLGLATVLGTAEQHGGTVRVETREGGGSVFIIVLPAAVDQTPPRVLVSAAPEGLLDQGVLNILVVDDEEQVAEVARRILETSGHTVHVALSAEAARVLWSQVGETIDLVVCDVVMPRASGPELVKELRQQGENLRVLFMSGYNEAAVHAQFEHPFLSKPFTKQQLLDAISRALR